MPDTADWTIVLSGPLAQRATLLAALERGGIDLSEPQPRQNPSHGLPTERGEGWITCRHPDVDGVCAVAARAGWALRLHWPTPPPAALAPEAQRVADLEARIARLEQRR